MDKGNLHHEAILTVSHCLISLNMVGRQFAWPVSTRALIQWGLLHISLVWLAWSDSVYFMKQCQRFWGSQIRAMWSEKYSSMTLYFILQKRVGVDTYPFIMQPVLSLCIYGIHACNSPNTDETSISDLYGHSRLHISTFRNLYPTPRCICPRRATPKVSN